MCERILNCYSLDCPGVPSFNRITNKGYEPKEVRRYLEWSSKVINKYGQDVFSQVTNCVTDGEKRDWDLFHSAIKIF